MIGAIDVVGVGVKLASELGVGTVVANVCKAYIPEAASTATKVCVGVATMGIAGAVGAATDNWWDEQVENVKKITKSFKSAKEKTEEIETEVEVEAVEVTE